MLWFDCNMPSSFKQTQNVRPPRIVAQLRGSSDSALVALVLCFTHEGHDQMIKNLKYFFFRSLFSRVFHHKIITRTKVMQMERQWVVRSDCLRSRFVQLFQYVPPTTIVETVLAYSVRAVAVQ